MVICNLGHPTTPTYSYVRKFSDVLGPFVKDIHTLGKKVFFSWTDECTVLNDILYNKWKKESEIGQICVYAFLDGPW